MTVETVVTLVPIDIEQFTDATDEGPTRTTNGERIVRFLAANDDKAFTPAEIADGTDVKRSSVGTVLRRLEDRDLVRHKGDYWAIGNAETVRDAFDFHRTVEDLDDQYGAEDVSEWREHAAEGEE
mgnify:FL=1